MIHRTMPEAYKGKPQAYIKHTILKSYLQRLFMIIGQGRAPVINYVDCFAGPWQEEDDTLSDTSISISLRQMSLCQMAHEKMFKNRVRFRALYIEKDATAFAKLQSYLACNPFPTIEATCLHGDYTQLVKEIIEWRQSHFTFFFVDPKGWKDVGVSTMAPLLQLPNSEFLINFMYEFINRFVEHPGHCDDMVELFDCLPQFAGESPEQRRQTLLGLYRSHLNSEYGGKTAYVPVEKPGSQKLFYYLVYLTRSPKGIAVFKEQAEKCEVVQRITQQDVKLRQKAERTLTDDLFGHDSSPVENHYSDNRNEAKSFLLNKLSEKPLRIDNELWAAWLENTDLYPGDFQLAMKELLKEGKVKNLDANLSKRQSKTVKPDWPDKSERWVLIV